MLRKADDIADERHVEMPEKIMQLIAEGVTGRPGVIAVTGGTVTGVEWSPDGVNFVKMAAATGVTFPVSPGDSIKITWSVKPTVKFYPARA